MTARTGRQRMNVAGVSSRNRCTFVRLGLSAHPFV